MGYTVSTDALRQAAGLVNEAHQFFNNKLAGLREIIADSADKPFDGGYGETGSYVSRAGARAAQPKRQPVRLDGETEHHAAHLDSQQARRAGRLITMTPPHTPGGMWRWEPNPEYVSYLDDVLRLGNAPRLAGMLLSLDNPSNATGNTTPCYLNSPVLAPPET